MRRPRVRESTLAHLVTAVVVLLAIGALASGPLGRSPQEVSSGPLVAASLAQAGSQPSDGSTVRPASAEESVRSRGNREGDPSTGAGPAGAQDNSPQPTATAQPTTTTALAPIPASILSALSQMNPVPRVGIQAGHWKENELPAELASLRGSTGAEGNGWKEVDINLDIARRVVALLQQQKVVVDLIPSTVPVQYKADAFVALHGDANSNTNLTGYKLARSSRSSIPAKDDALLNAVSSEYAAATSLPFHSGTITPNMTAYYAFANRGIDHSIAPTTPGVILEMGFLTTTKDRNLLTQQPDLVAAGIVTGILRFLVGK